MKNLARLIFLLILSSSLFAQTDSETGYAEIFVIDSFVSPKPPYKFKLTFFTDAEVKSKLVFDNKYTFDISEVPSDEHKIEVDLTDYTFDSLFVPYYVILIYDDEEARTEQSFVEYPYEEEIKVSKFESLLRVCAGSLVFLIPSPGLTTMNDKLNFTLSKELPLFTFYSGGFNYPNGYLGIEYTYVFDAPQKNFLRFGYKQIWETSGIEFVSIGATGFTNFLGFNGFSPEATLGLFKINNAMTIYARYRYNIRPDETSMNFHDISVGIYSHFFSLNF